MTTTRLTIYSQSGHLVERFPATTGIIPLPNSVEIASIVAIDTQGQIIPFTYLAPTSLGTALIDRQTGEKVEVTVTKDNSTTTGKIMSLDGSNVTLLTPDQITSIRKYDQITVNLQEPDLTRPRLHVESNQPFILSYLVSNIGWTCVGTILIDNETMHLRLAGNINNQTETDISAVTTLVSGDVYQNRHRQEVFATKSSFMTQAASASPMVSRKVETTLTEDYTKYEVGPHLLQAKNIVELGTSTYPINKIYIHRTHESDRVTWGYRFVATGFIPSCAVNVYAIDDQRSIGAYLGSDTLPESQSEDEIDIILGESSMLQCTSLVVVSDVTLKDEVALNQYKLSTSEHGGAWHIITEELTVEITNHNRQAVILILKHPVGDKSIQQITCQSFKQRKDGYIEWYFEIPPATGAQPRKETFSCKVATARWY